MRILFASIPADGHVLPLTGIATHLASRGHEVRFYTGPSFEERLVRLGLTFAPYERAEEISAENLTEIFPEYAKLGNGPKAIEFAATKIFFGSLEGQLADLQAIRATFPYDALVCDAAFYAAHLLVKKHGVPVYAVGAAPSPAPTSPTAPPPFFGLRPATNVLRRLQHRVVRAMVNGSLKKGMALLNDLLAREGLPTFEGSAFDLPAATAQVLFQAGCPSMDFPRDDWPASFRFVGPLLPARRPSSKPFDLADRLAAAEHVVVVSQGTIDNRDPEKLIAPTLTALAGGPHLVVACTGGRHTEALRARFPQPNVIVEDWVDFAQLLPQADVFVTNGGYGSVMHALVSRVPLLLAGELEGKNDVNARLDYRGLGIDLRTERPKPRAIAAGVARLLSDPSFGANVARVAEELASYRPLEIIEEAIVSPKVTASSRPASPP